MKMKLIEEWAPSGNSEDIPGTWIAAAEIHEGGPVVAMAVWQDINGRWRGRVEYRDELGSFGQSGFETRDGAMSWCELTADTLGGGGR